MAELKATRLQRRLFAEVGKHAVVLHLTHTDNGAAHTLQHIGAHVTQRLCQVVQLVSVFHAVPAIGAFGQKLVIVLTCVVAGIKEVLKVVEAHAVDVQLPLLRAGRQTHCQQRDEE